jgi:lysophospholipid acyltransferase (LPLAT)-like uncharacterized protein
MNKEVELKEKVVVKLIYFISLPRNLFTFLWGIFEKCHAIRAMILIAWHSSNLLNLKYYTNINKILNMYSKK